MVTVHVLKSFYDLKHHKDRKAGSTFEATEERAAHIDAALPGYVAYEADESKANDRSVADLTKLTVAQLRALCAERGVETPPKAKKAELVDLLKE